VDLAPDAAKTAPSGEEDNCGESSFWERSLLGWHVAFYGLLGATALIGFFEDGLAGVRPWYLAVLAAMAVWYAVVGARAVYEENNGRGLTYLVGVTALLLVLTQLGQPAFLLLFVVFPQIWAMLTTRWAIITTIGVVTALTIAQMAEGGWTSDAIEDPLLFGLIQICFCLLLGLWITGVINEGERLARLVEELRSTRAELAIANRVAGELAERERLATEIHDTLAQGFTSIVMLAQAADRAGAKGDVAAMRDRVAMVERTARENLEEARSLVAALTPVDLDAGLGEALVRLAARFERELGVRTTVTVTGEARSLSRNAEIVLLRAAQEALANVRKHSGAGRVTVALHQDAAGIELEVSDDGRGFDGEPPDGYGLPGMRARAEQIGGAVEVRSAAGRGTAVRVRVP
jgi:signal transduction histidine kinase